MPEKELNERILQEKDREIEELKSKIQILEKSKKYIPMDHDPNDADTVTRLLAQIDTLVDDYNAQIYDLQLDLYTKKRELDDRISSADKTINHSLKLLSNKECEILELNLLVSGKDKEIKRLQDYVDGFEEIKREVNELDDESEKLSFSVFLLEEALNHLGADLLTIVNEVFRKLSGLE